MMRIATIVLIMVSRVIVLFMALRTTQYNATSLTQRIKVNWRVANDRSTLIVYRILSSLLRASQIWRHISWNSVNVRMCNVTQLRSGVLQIVLLLLISPLNELLFSFFESQRSHWSIAFRVDINQSHLLLVRLLLQMKVIKWIAIAVRNLPRFLL